MFSSKSPVLCGIFCAYYRDGQKAYNRLMSTEIGERGKEIRSVAELMRIIGYRLSDGNSSQSAYRDFEKVIDELNLVMGRIHITETRLGSKHILVSAGYNGKFSAPVALEKTIEGLVLPTRNPEGYRNADLESGGYNKILDAILILEKNGFFVDKAGKIKAGIESTKLLREQLEQVVLEEIIPQLREVLTGFEETENNFLKNGTIYLFPKSKSTDKMVPVVKVSINVHDNTMELIRSSARIITSDNGLAVDKKVFEKKRMVKKGKYQFSYYVWKDDMAALEKGIKKLDWFMSELKN